MIKNIIFSFVFSAFLISSSFAAGSSDSGSSNTETKYDMAVTHIKVAKKFEEKDKIEKAKKRYEKAQKLLLQSNKKYPNKAEGIISQGVAAIMGADCSGVTGAIASNVAVPNGVVMISPSATSPGLTTLDDKGYFFRTAPSDARGGQILADVTKDRKIKSVAITYTNNDYGKGLADVYKAAVEAHGIKVTTVTAHEDGKADYSSEVATLASAGGDAVAVIGYLDQGGKGIIQASLDSGAFDKFILSDGMIGQSLVDAFGKDLNKSFGSLPGSTGKGAGVFAKVASAAGIDSSGPYTGESYDAAALIVLAMQAGNSADRASIAKNVMDVANGPGTKIYPGELKKGLDLLAKGKKVDYEGATGVTFTSVGEAEGSFLEQEVKGGKFKTKKQR
ncbi:ABC transporter substrate-binding protein [Candidatus Pelagibacter sp.]|nr:ABC transporter substrate-binding protein [Candidatus Pelagibacter sp.]